MSIANIPYFQYKQGKFIANVPDNHQYRNILYPLYKKWVVKRGERITNEHVLLNWHIFLAPMHVIDYFIAHELAHLTVMDCSEACCETFSYILIILLVKKSFTFMNDNYIFIL